MNDTDELLPELMRRATDRLDQPDATALVERGVRRGAQLRRRRTIGISIAAASAVVLAATGAFAVRSLLPSNDLQVAGPLSTPSEASDQPASKPSLEPSPKPSNEPTGLPTTSRLTGWTPSEKDTIEVLTAIVPKELTTFDPETWGNDGSAGARITVDDGKGQTELSAFADRDTTEIPSCPAKGNEQKCHQLPDGSVVLSMQDVREYADGHPSDLGAIYNTVTVRRPDGLGFTLTNYNALAEKGSPTTRDKPSLSVAELTELAQDGLARLASRAPGTKLQGR